MIEIKYYAITEIIKLKDNWHRLEAGQDMTYYQTYDWYEMLVNINKSKINNNVNVFFLELLEDGKVQLIAPLYVIKKDFRIYNKQGVYLWGDYGWTDYANFIYLNFEGRYIDSLFDWIKKIYGLNRFVLNKIREETHLAQYLQIKFNVLPNRNICVSLLLPDTKVLYLSSLSKKTKQNIRTALNRATKDNILFEFNYDDSNINIKDFSYFRDIRVRDKNRINLFSIMWWKNLIGERLLYSFMPYKPFVEDKNSHFMTIKTSDGVLCASFNYGYDIFHKGIIVMAVSTNPEYYKYSPGILLLYNFILNSIQNKQLRCVDFTLGNEPYKYSLGGSNHYVNNYSFNA